MSTPCIGAGEKLVGRLAPGAFDRLPAGIFQPVDLIDAGTADDAENCFGHEKGRFLCEEERPFIMSGAFRRASFAPRMTVR